MTASEFLSEAATLAQQTAEYESLTTQHTLTGIVFRHDQPLPPLRNHRPRHAWETEKDNHG